MPIQINDLRHASKHIVRPIGVLCFATLAACGGGGSDPPAPPCIPRVAHVVIFGDSTQGGCCASNDDHSPRVLLQQAMDRRFGAGAVVVTSRAVGATAGWQLVAGTDGVNPPWSQIPHADVTVVNHGINDEGSGQTVEQYKATLRVFAATTGVIFETPNPVVGRGDSFARAMREVAAAAGRPIADVDAYVRSLNDWPQYLGDGVHPTWEGYDLIVGQVVAPVVAFQVAPLRCEVSK